MITLTDMETLYRRISTRHQTAKRQRADITVSLARDALVMEVFVSTSPSQCQWYFCHVTVKKVVCGLHL